MALLCQKAGCGKPATHALQIGCGTFTDPDDMPARAKILLGVMVCEPCMEGETAERFLEANPDLGRLLAIAMSGGPPPDLARAFIGGVELDSAEGRELQLQQLDNRH